MDSPGLWCVPCGYMDWDENGVEALTREVYEETGLYLPDYADHSLLNMEDPFYVKTDPAENRQNISLSYTNVYRFEEFDEEKFNLVLSTIEKYKSEEVTKAKLIKITNINRYQWAFNHNNRIQSAVDFIHESMIDLLSGVITDNLFDLVNQESEETLPWWKQILTFWRN
jgi:ADP-ribose pyrophosphatase YjhB (NUDIX family)